MIGSDGNLTGYRWGVARKRALLEKERTLAGDLRIGAAADDLQSEIATA